MDLDYKNCTAYVGLDADENRTIRYVGIDTVDGDPVERIPFKTREEAEKLARKINEL